MLSYSCWTLVGIKIMPDERAGKASINITSTAHV